VAADSLAAAWGFPGPPPFPSLGQILGGTVSSDREPKRSVVMDNRLVDATWTYHNGTKHSPESVRTNAHFLDWPNQPLLFKVYSTLEPLPLPGDLAPPAMPALVAIRASGADPLGPDVPDLRTLAGILFFSAGITRRRAVHGGEILFRAAACTGALYHIELYLVCGDLPDLEAGVYHFGVHDSALRKLRAGDHRGAVVKATAGEPSIAAAPAIIVCTGTYWRNAWKYQARTYRHCFWDTGTILANLLAASVAFEVPARIVCGFVDAEVNRLLDLDVEREVALTLIPLGRDRTSAPAAIPEVGPLGLPTEPLSKTEVDLSRDPVHARSLVAGPRRSGEGVARPDASSGPSGAFWTSHPAPAARGHRAAGRLNRPGDPPTRLHSTVRPRADHARAALHDA
jgi:SagB-type dehydrogenase family enzyme